jgi:plastocyanin
MTRVRSLLLLLTVLALTFCGGGGGVDDDEPEPRPVTVDIVEISASVDVGTSFQFHVTVSNTTNKACAWSVNGVAGGSAALGTISSDGLYSAPAAVPDPAQVTVKAVAAADTTKSDTAVVTVIPPAPFSISPSAATVAAGATQQFTTTADVTWSVEAAAGNTAPAGSISAGGLYTAPFSPPLGGSVTIIATSKYDTSVKATATATVTFSDASLHGAYAFLFRSAGTEDVICLGGRLEADGAGGVSNGVLDMHLNSGPREGLLFTGTYQVAADGRASLTLEVDASTIPLRLVLSSDRSGRLIGFASGESGFGEIEKQDLPPWPGLADGPFVFAYAGFNHYDAESFQPGQPVAAAGRFTLDFFSSSENILNVIADVNQNGQWIQNGGDGTTYAGSYTYDAATGRGSLGFGVGASGAISFFVYALSPDEALLLARDWHVLGSRYAVTGRVVRAGAGPFSAASVSGNLAMASHGCTAVAVPTPDPFVPPEPAFSSGVLTSDAAGHFTTGLADTNVGGTVGQALSVTGTYAVAASGRGTSSVTMGGLSDHAALYLLAGNTAYAVGLDAWGTGVSLFRPQSGGRPFSAASLSGHYAFALRGTLTRPGNDAVGQVLFDGQGGLTGWVDVNAGGVPSANVAVSGTYTMNSTGRGRATVYSSAGTWALTMYLEDAATLSLVRTDAPGDGCLVRQY